MAGRATPNDASARQPPSSPRPNKNGDGRSTPVTKDESTASDPLVEQDDVGPTNLTASHLSSLSSRLFLSHLSSIPSAKTLLLDPSLAGPLGLVVDTSSLKSVGVEKMFWMESAARSGESAAGSDGAGQVRPRSVNAPTKAVVYVCRPEQRWTHVIKSHIEYDVANSTGSSLAHTYHALLTPHRTELSLLSLTPVLPHLSLYDFGLEFVPLEPDLLSLEEPGAAWHDFYVRGDQTVLHRCAMSLMTCQMLWGCFPRISGKGDFAKRLADLLLRQRREHLASDPSNPSLNSYSDVIDGLVIVERGTDMVTPMCNQLTYTGLIDELVGIKSAHVEMATDAQNAKAGAEHGSSSTPLVSAPQRPTKKHRLDPMSDVLYAHIRDLNFSVVGSTLHAFAKRLSTSYDGRHAAQTVSEMRAWVGKLGGLQSEHTALKLHTTLTEKLMAETNTELFNRCLEIQQNIVAGIDLATQAAAIEDLIHLEAPVQTVLRLLCLLSITGGGLKGKALDAIKRDVCQVYGFHWLPALVELERTGLLVSSKSLPIPVSGSATGNSSAFDRVRQPLKLINDEVSEEDPSDVAYVYSGYAPLSVRLVQAVGQKEALMKAGSFGGGNTSGNGAPGKATSRSKPRAHPLVGWKGFEDVLGAIPGETFDLQQGLTNTASAGSTTSDGSGNFSAKNGSDPDRPRTTVVFFLGGITYAEVAALRFMGKTSRNRRWLIATTGIINGNGIVDDVARGSARGRS